MRLIVPDVETYGAVRRNFHGHEVPRQTVFNAQRSLHLDGCLPHDLCQTISITVPANQCDGPPTLPAIAALRPGPTFTLNLADPAHFSILIEWLTWADTLLNQNLVFDLMYLRACRPELHDVLDGRHFLVELMVLNFLDSDIRPQRSLKEIGPALGLFSYNQGDDYLETLRKGGTYESPHDPKLHLYAAADTHNTTTGAIYFARSLCGSEIKEKTTPFTLEMFSDLQYASLRMQESGMPMSRSKIEAHIERLEQQKAEYQSHIPFPMSGKGSGTAKNEYIATLAADNPDIANHPLLEITTKTKQVSTKLVNLKLFLALLPDDHPCHQVLSSWIAWQKAQKLITSFLTKLLAPVDPKKPNKDRLWFPSSSSSPFSSSASSPHHDADVGIAFPVVYLVPSRISDTDEGGQRQGRISVNGPALQTFPGDIKAHRVSHWADGHLVECDLSQIELRTAGLLSGEPTICDAYIEGRDLHTEMAQWLYGPECIHDHDFKSLKRQLGKTLNFSGLYRSGVDRLMLICLRTMGIIPPRDIIAKAVRDRPIQRPVLWEWQERIIAMADRDHYLHLPETGQSRTFLGGRQFHKPQEMVNFPVQLTAANVTSRITSYVHRHIPPVSERNPHIRLVLNTHDSLTFSCRDRTAAEEAIEIYGAAVRWVETQDYWSTIQDRLGRRMPLEYDAEIK